MTSHLHKLTLEEMNRASRSLSWYQIPKVKSAKEAEARTKTMSKTYLPKEVQRKKTLSEKKNVSDTILTNGSKELHIKRMSGNERSNRLGGYYTIRIPKERQNKNQDKKE